MEDTLAARLCERLATRPPARFSGHLPEPRLSGRPCRGPVWTTFLVFPIDILQIRTSDFSATLQDAIDYNL